jgi:hypothetical protein
VPFDEFHASLTYDITDYQDFHTLLPFRPLCGKYYKSAVSGTFIFELM